MAASPPSFSGKRKRPSSGWNNSTGKAAAAAAGGAGPRIRTSALLALLWALVCCNNESAVQSFPTTSSTPRSSWRSYRTNHYTEAPSSPFRIPLGFFANRRLRTTTTLIITVRRSAAVEEAAAVDVVEEEEETERRPLPPWLDRHRSATRAEAGSAIEDLEDAMLERGGLFSAADVREVVRALRRASRGDPAVAAGTVDFCRLLLALGDGSGDSNVGDNEQHEPSCDGFATKEVLVASILHYADCIAARRQGLHEAVRTVVHGGNPCNSNAATMLLPPSDDATEEPRSFYEPSAAFSSSSASAVDAIQQQNASIVPSLLDSAEVRSIADGAARIKRAEILAQSVRADAVEDGTAAAASWRTPAQASRMRGLLLSVMDDWRSLAIRCVACLYRLEGIVQQLDDRGGGETAVASYLERTPEVVRTAREAMRIYAPLAQQMGMHRLKAKIEERAFRILYRRQYRVVSSLYRDKADSMEKLSSYLLTQISQTLHQDEALMYQVEDLQLSSRVKEPYSFWKKLLKKKLDDLPRLGDSKSRPVAVMNDAGRTRDRLRSSTDSSSLTVADVQDGIALRVILRARKYAPDESDETTRERERLLCYYVQHLIRSNWPEIESSRVKDYIQFPKLNGYQSLHHTSSIQAHGMEFPFEIQIRSEEMHQVAEFGLASHLDYKLGNASAPSLESSFDNANGANVFLPPPDEEEIATNNTDDRSVAQVPLAPSSSNSYLGALVHTKQGLNREKVYIFLAGSAPSISEQGSIVTLPPGSRVEDAVMLANARNDAEDKTIWRNGRLARVDDRVENGDIVLIQ